MSFIKGDRVKLNYRTCEERGIFKIRRANKPNVRGTVTSMPHNGKTVGVKWDDTKWPERISMTFLVKVDEEAELVQGQI